MICVRVAAHDDTTNHRKLERKKLADRCHTLRDIASNAEQCREGCWHLYYVVRQLESLQEESQWSSNDERDAYNNLFRVTHRTRHKVHVVIKKFK